MPVRTINLQKNFKSGTTKSQTLYPNYKQKPIDPFQYLNQSGLPARGIINRYPDNRALKSNKQIQNPRRKTKNRGKKKKRKERNLKTQFVVRKSQKKKEKKGIGWKWMEEVVVGEAIIPWGVHSNDELLILIVNWERSPRIHGGN